MNRAQRIRGARHLLIVAVALGTAAAVAAPAGASSPVASVGKVGPKQYFTGVINGTDGNTSTPIVIDMACFGPLTPGETGHPMSGQTLAVHQLFPPSTAKAGTLGYTGKDSAIGFFTAAPPSAGGPAAAAADTTFTRYDKTRPLPTSLTLPCAGTGTVWFSPIPVIPPSRGAAVPVEFVGQP